MNSLKSIEDSNDMESDLSKGLFGTWVLKNWNKFKNFLTGKAQREVGKRVKTNMAGIRPRSKGGKTADRPTRSEFQGSLDKRIVGKLKEIGNPPTRAVEDAKRLANRKRLVEKLTEVENDPLWQ